MEAGQAYCCYKYSSYMHEQSPKQVTSKSTKKHTVKVKVRLCNRQCGKLCVWQRGEQSR